MSIFSKLWKKNPIITDDSEDTLPLSQETEELPIMSAVQDFNWYLISDIVSKLKELDGTETIIAKLQSYASSNTTDKDKYVNILEQLIEKKDGFTTPPTLHQLFTNTLNKMTDVISLDFHPKLIEFFDFDADSKPLFDEFDILTTLKEIMPELYDNEDLEEFYSDFKSQIEEFTAVKQAVVELKTKEDELSKQIETFISTVNQLNNTYRLSADWNGKKPQMIALRKQLFAQREQYIEVEKIIMKKLEPLYPVLTAIHESFKEIHQLFIKDIQNKFKELQFEQPIENPYIKIIDEFQQLFSAFK